jgi:parallel beta-helix repeat protein
VEGIRFICNTVRGSAWGVFLAYTHGGHLLKNNEISRCRAHGIRVARSENIRIQGGSVSSCMHDISLKEASRIVVEGVNLQGGGFVGMQIEHANDNTIRGNRFSGHALGLWIADSAGNRIVENTFQYGPGGRDMAAAGAGENELRGNVRVR